MNPDSGCARANALDASDHALFRETARRFVAREVTPHIEAWEEAGIVPREWWRRAGEAGLLCVEIDPAHGGAGGDFRGASLVIEEVMRAGAGGLGSALSVHSDIVAIYLDRHGTEAQRRAWLPRMARGDAIGAIAMSEPGAGSDLQGVRTTARRDGDSYLLSGQKTFITNGHNAGLCIVVAKTDPRAGAHGISLFLVDAALPGFRRGRKLDKVGQHMSDTSEIFLDEVRVPATALLGGENRGFGILMSELPRERLLLAVGAIAAAEAAIEWTVAYTSERTAFGKRIAEFQNTRFTLAQLKAEVTIGRTFVDRCVDLLTAGALDAGTAAMAKLWLSQLQSRVADACLQLHGGYGYMREYPISRAWADARVQQIYGGSNEVMKEIIARDLFGKPGA